MQDIRPYLTRWNTELSKGHNSRELQRRQLEILGSEHPFRRADRHARLDVNVSQLWLEAYRARETIRLIQQDRELIETLSDPEALEKFARENKKQINRISTSAIDLLIQYHWPGNVRELFNILERAVVAAGDEKTLYAMHLPRELRIDAVNL